MLSCAPFRVCGRAVECTGLENRRGETHREFESHRTRQNYQQKERFSGAFFVPID